MNIGRRMVLFIASNKVTVLTVPCKAAESKIFEKKK